jgi:putative transposase
LTRYVHLNPTTAFLVDKPGDWRYSSYEEYIQQNSSHRVCEYNQWLKINCSEYKTSTEDQIDLQRKLAMPIQSTPGVALRGWGGLL